MAKREVQEINASSMADIAFLLLIFFLVTTTMAVDKGLSRQLPPPIPPGYEPPTMLLNERNVMKILVNSQNQLMVEGKQLDISELKDFTKDFVKNEYKKAELPEVEQINVPLLGVMNVTNQHVISMQNDRGTEYQAYLEAQNEMMAAYNELREELAKEKFGVHYEDLNKDQQKAIQTVYPLRISEAEPKNYGGK